MEKNTPHDSLTSNELRDKGLKVSYGWSEGLAHELVECSRQEHITRHTPKDAGSRFKDLESAMKWYESGQRHVYALRDNENKLAGIIWYGANQRNDLGAANTFAIRLYEQAQGKGASLPFMKAVHEDFVRRAEDSSVWLETDTGNERARSLYESFGYETVAEADGRVTMVYGQGIIMQ